MIRVIESIILRIIIMIIIVLVCNFGFGQNERTIFSFRNFSSTLVLELSNDSFDQFVLDEFGDLKDLKNSGSPFTARFVFQSQEYDGDLGIYFFPSRIYSPASQKFFQPDPKSQYFSSYLFVNADPVNIIDKDGKEGKNLVLNAHEDGGLLVDHIGGEEKNYNYTLSDFMDHKIPDLEEWNGNVYVSSHMSADGMIVLEKGKVGSLKTQNLLDEQIAMSSKIGDKTEVMISGDKFGEKLRSFSAERNVQLKNVVMAGCEGECAAGAVADGIMFGQAQTKFSGEINFFGPKRGMMLVPVEVDGVTHWSYAPKGSTDLPFTTMKKYKGKNVRWPGFEEKETLTMSPNYGDPSESVPESLLEHGRVPANSEEFVRHITGSY